MAVQELSVRVEAAIIFCVLVISICGEPATASKPLWSLAEKEVKGDWGFFEGASILQGVYNTLNRFHRSLRPNGPLRRQIDSVQEPDDQWGPARMLAEPVWPTPTGSVRLTQTIHVYGEFNGGYKMYWGLGDGSNSEHQPPMFMVHPGGVVRNVVIGPPAGDGIICRGSCKLINVWWLDVGEDAATLRGKDPNQVMEINGGGARSASDKVFQHNGPGTMIIRNFRAEDIGKLYRACGSCPGMRRDVVIENVFLSNVHTAVAGINVNTGDTARIRGVTLARMSKRIDVCQKYRTEWGGSYKLGGGADGQHCFFDPSTVRYVNGGYNPGPLSTPGGTRGRVVRRSRVRRVQRRKGMRRRREGMRRRKTSSH